MKILFSQPEDNRLEEFGARLIIAGILRLPQSGSAKKQLLQGIIERLVREGRP